MWWIPEDEPQTAKIQTEQTTSCPNQDWNQKESEPNWEQNQTKENQTKTEPN